MVRLSVEDRLPHRAYSPAAFFFHLVLHPPVPDALGFLWIGLLATWLRNCAAFSRRHGWDWGFLAAVVGYAVPSESEIMLDLRVRAKRAACLTCVC